MRRVLSERDQLRALMLVAAACGSNRVGAIAEGGARHSELGGLFGAHAFWNHDLPLVGTFLAAALIHRRGARTAAIAAAAACALASVLSTAGVVPVGAVVSSVGTGAFTVSALAFAAELLVPDEEHVSSSRFTGMAVFVFTRAAMMNLGTMAWGFVPYGITRERLVDRGIGVLFAFATVAAVIFALPRGEAQSAATPVQPVYRAPSPIEEQPAAAPRVPPKVWPAVRPFVAPAALFAFSTSAVAYRMGSIGSNLFGGATAIAGAIYFVRAWRRWTNVSVVDWYARGLMVAAAGWLLLGIGSFVGIVTYVGAIAAAVGGTASGLSLGLVALAARGRRAGVALACWLVLTSAATSVSELFVYGVGVMILFAAVLSFVVARGLKRRARELEASL